MKDEPHFLQNYEIIFQQYLQYWT